MKRSAESMPRTLSEDGPDRVPNYPATVEAGSGEQVRTQSVERALDILLCLSEQPCLGPTELGARLGLHKSTVYRLLRALGSRGFVSTASQGERYELGPAVLLVAERLLDRPRLRDVALPEMIGLRDRTGETVSIHLRVGDHRVCIEQVESRQDIRRAQQVGQILPLYAGAMGKALLVDFGPERLRALVERTPLQALTPSTPPSLEQLASNLLAVAQEGYAVSFGERVVGCTTVAVPLRDASREVSAALGISGPSFRFTAERARGAASLLMEAGQRITRARFASPSSAS